MKSDILNPFNSKYLYKLDKEFLFLSELLEKNKYPRVSMISGEKGIGKSTLIVHVLSYLLDSNNYDKNNFQILDTSRNLSLQEYNLIYIQNSAAYHFNIDDCRELKKKLEKSNINNKPRIILIDDAELMNLNTINALLKITEEPLTYNYFIFINNSSKEIFSTLKSRCIEFNIRLKKKDKNTVTQKLIDQFKIETILNHQNSNLSPGNYLNYNYLCKAHKIEIASKSLIKNINTLTNAYKKEKNIQIIGLIKYLSEINFYNKDITKENYPQKVIEKYISILRDLTELSNYNLNQKIILNKISGKINDQI